MKFLARHEIDDEIWNARVSNDPEFRHYYLTHFLDAASEHWEALVSDDLSMIWPLPFKTFPLKRVYQPIFAQQLGPLISANKKETLGLGLDRIRERYLLGRMKLHSAIERDWLPSYAQQRNVVLPLDQPYEMIQKGYNRNVRSNLKKFEKSTASVLPSHNDGPAVIKLFRDHKGSELKVANETFFRNLEAIYQSFWKRGETETWVLEDGGQLMAGVILLNSGGYLLNLLSIVTSGGRQMGGTHAVFDGIIQHHAGRSFSLDFEGSNDDNLAFFYKSFGGSEVLYLQHEWSRLPWPLSKLL